jgi:hypothetical protein
MYPAMNSFILVKIPPYLTISLMHVFFQLKPNNHRSINQGIKQLKRYNAALGGGFTLILEVY